MVSLKLSERLRKELKEPLGELFSSIDDVKIDSKIIICVGDETTKQVLNSGILPKICIYDGKVMRKSVPIPDILKNHNAEEIHVRNPPGHLTKEIFNVLGRALASKSNIKIVVDGEEDLAVLAAIDLAPIDSLILYGQPHEGVVAIKVDKRIKDKVKGILREMGDDRYIR